VGLGWVRDGEFATEGPDSVPPQATTDEANNTIIKPEIARMHFLPLLCLAINFPLITGLFSISNYDSFCQ
jgi:hypothetical protein